MGFELLAPMLWTAIALWYVTEVARVVYNLLLHPLKTFPGPLAARVTDWWKTYIEVFKQESMVDVLLDLHKRYGSYLKICPVYLC